MLFSSQLAAVLITPSPKINVRGIMWIAESKVPSTVSVRILMT